MGFFLFYKPYCCGAVNGRVGSKCVRPCIWLGLADEDSCGEDETSANDHLKTGEGEAGLEVAMADEGDDDKFDSNDGVSPGEGGVDVRDKKWKRVKEASNEGHEAGDDSAEDGVSAAGELTVVGQTLRRRPWRCPRLQRMAAPIKKTVRELCVAKAVAKIGARVETEPSISPARPG